MQIYQIQKNLLYIFNLVIQQLNPKFGNINGQIYFGSQNVLINRIENQVILFSCKFQGIFSKLMNVLQSQPSLSISTNECKKQFLTNEVNQMRLTKQIYNDVLLQLKTILKETSNLTVSRQKSQNPLQQSDTHSKQSPSQVRHGKNSMLLSDALLKSNKSQQKRKILKIDNFNKNIKQKISEYCCTEISQNLVKYLEIQQQETNFYSDLITQLKFCIKNNQKFITQREKQLQNVEQMKYGTENDKQNQNSQLKALNKNFIGKIKKNTEKTISSFDVNRKILEVIKRQIALLKLRKRRLQINLQQKRQKQLKNQQKAKVSQVSQNLIQIKKHEQMQQKTTGGFSEQLNIKKLPVLRQNSPLKTQFTNKNDISGFQKIVMVYQKDKFLNDVMQQKINKLQKKLKNQKRQNTMLKQKTVCLQKQISKIDWNNVCDQSFMSIKNKKLPNFLQLSILDRTNLQPYEEVSVQYSKMSINQSMIK